MDTDLLERFLFSYQKLCNEFGLEIIHDVDENPVVWTMSSKMSGVRYIHEFDDMVIVEFLYKGVDK